MISKELQDAIDFIENRLEESMEMRCIKKLARAIKI